MIPSVEVSRHFPRRVPGKPHTPDREARLKEGTGRVTHKRVLPLTTETASSRLSVRSFAKERKSASPNPFLRRSRGAQGGVVSRNSALSPVAWKPWAKSLKSFSDNPGFLDDD
ncbi:unnamed protein product [Toxocara canis]|uniref:Myelin basic protein n=1 Tax=Toxocara canis TaxID=6265 RepID=A0A183U2W1_TOXCA|nr:unnamed protein product [Toxocara canis]